MKLPTTRILIGDVRDRLLELPAESVDCVVTSPPYWGLRDYGVDGQIGLETSLFDWLAEMVTVFGEVRRVLKPKGTLWLNLGDSYASDAWGGSLGRVTLEGSRRSMEESKKARKGPRVPEGLKPKDMIGQPWRVAFALQDDGWWLRSEIIWHKPSPMPESVKDRPTKAHETIFLLSKSRRYHYDAAAIAEPVTAPEANTEDDWSRAINRRRNVCPGRDQETVDPKRLKRNGNNERQLGSDFAGPGTNSDYGRSFPWEGSTRNSRTVWTFPSTPFPGAHFATFPEALPEKCIKAGCPAGGTVLDPFLGAGTTGLVAAKLGRSCIGIELSPKYAAMAEDRIRDNVGLLTTIEVTPMRQKKGKSPKRKPRGKATA